MAIISSVSCISQLPFITQRDSIHAHGIYTRMSRLCLYMYMCAYLSLICSSASAVEWVSDHSASLSPSVSREQFLHHGLVPILEAQREPVWHCLQLMYPVLWSPSPCCCWVVCWGAPLVVLHWDQLLGFVWLCSLFV